MSANFGFDLSYFRPSSPSSIDVWVDTGGKLTHGFQIVANVTADPALDLVDQNEQLSGIQLSINQIPGVNFITNQATKTADGYKLGLAAITSNPSQPFRTNGRLVVAKLIFKQATSGELTLQLDQNLTKMPLKNGGAIVLAPSSSTQYDFSQNNSTGLIITQPVGEQLKLLTGQMYVASPPTKNNQNAFTKYLLGSQISMTPSPPPLLTPSVSPQTQVARTDQISNQIPNHSSRDLAGFLNIQLLIGVVIGLLISMAILFVKKQTLTHH